MVRNLGIGLVGMFLAVSAVSADELKTINGKSITGTLERITDSEIILESGGKSVSAPLAQVLNLQLRPVRNGPLTEKHYEVVLVDDSFLRCSKVTLGEKEATLQLYSGVTVKAPMEAVLSMLRDAEEPKLKAQWDKLLKTKRNKDRIFILKDGDLNPIEGALGAVDEKKQSIAFKPDAGPAIQPGLDKLHGLQFAQVNVAAQASLCKVLDLHGSSLTVSKIKYEAGTFTVGTPFGQNVAVEGKSVTFVDFNFGRLTYLSDLETKLADVVLLGGFNPLRKDTNLDGYPIMLQDKQYAKGLSMYAGTDLEYNLDGKYKEFKALLGVDSRIAEEGQGKVTLTVYLDQAKVRSFEVSPVNATPIAINVKDVGKLRLVVTGSNFTNLSGHATLANAHVSQ